MFSVVLLGGTGQGQVGGWGEPGCLLLVKWNMASAHHQLHAAVRSQSRGAQSHTDESWGYKAWRWMRT